MINSQELFANVFKGRDRNQTIRLPIPTHRRQFSFRIMQLPGHMQLMQPMLRPGTVAIGPHGTLIGGNMLRPGPLQGMPAGLLPMQTIGLPGLPAGAMPMPGMGVMLPGHPNMLQVMQPRYR